MRSVVLDAYAMLVYLQGEPGYEAVRDLLADAVEGAVRLEMTSVNVGEVLYRTLREKGEAKLAEAEALVAALPVEVVAVDYALAREAARLKATKKMSYADCFAAALAKLRGGQVVTGDLEFRQVEPDIQVLWM